MFFTILLIAIILLCLLLSIFRNGEESTKQIPGPSIFRLIYIIATSKDVQRIILNLYEEFGPIFKIHIKPFKPVVFTSNAENIQKVLASKDNWERTYVSNSFESYLGQGLGTIRSAKEWKIDRQVVNHAMGHDFLSKLLYKSQCYIDQLCETVMQEVSNKPIDIQMYAQETVLNVVIESLSAASIGLDRKQVIDYSEARHSFFNLLKDRLFSVYFIPDVVHKLSQNYTDTEEVTRKLNTLAKDLFYRHKMIPQHQKDRNFIQVMIDGGMSDDRIIDNINTIIEAGHATTALATTWIMYELSRNKVIQQSILQETIDVLGNNLTKEITLKEVQEMKYIECFVNEILRYYTIVGYVVRKTGKPLNINNSELPEGTTIAILAQVMHMSSEYYDNPEEFNPERFLPENRDKLNSNAYIPFSAGNRNCIGGWRIMKNWNMADHDGTSLLISLQVKYGISPWTKISVDPHPNSPGSSIIKISPSSLGLPDKSYYFNSRNDDAIEKAYVQFISDVVINFSATKEEADRFGRTLYNYEKRIAEIKPDSSQFQDPIQTYHLITIRELTETVPQLAIGDIVAKMYPDATIDSSTEVIVTSPAYLSEVARIITSSAKETINDYYIWTLVREYLPYLNTKFAASWNAFNKEIFGINKPPDRWEFCVNLVQKFMGLAVEVLLDKRNPITNNTRTVVNEVYESIRLTVNKRLTKYKSKLNLHKHIITKINTTQLEIGLPRNISTDEYVKSFYRKLSVIKKSFFDNYKHGVTFLKKIEERRLTQNVVDDYLLSYIYSKPSYVYYSPSENKIVIPNILLSDFYFEDRYPWSVIFGRLGVEIAEAMVSSILPYDNVWTAEHRLLTEFHSAVTESISVIKTPQSCLRNFMLKYHQVDETIANLTSLNVVKTISAVQIAEEALNDFIIASKLHVHQPSFEEMEDSGLFYLTYSQTLCSLTADQYKLYDGIRNYKFPHKALLFTLWFQAPGFSSAYSCPANTITPCSDIF